MRVLTAAIIGLLLSSSVAVAQDLPVVVGEVFEYKVIVNVGPIKYNAKNKYNVPSQTEREVDDAAEYVCSLYGRYAYPINVSESDSCVSGPDETLTQREIFTRALLGCIKYYLYACGTHQVD